MGVCEKKVLHGFTALQSYDTVRHFGHSDCN